MVFSVCVKQNLILTLIILNNSFQFQTHLLITVFVHWSWWRAGV